MLELGIDNRRFKAQEDAIQCRIDLSASFIANMGAFRKTTKKHD